MKGNIGRESKGDDGGVEEEKDLEESNRKNRDRRIRKIFCLGKLWSKELFEGK